MSGALDVLLTALTVLCWVAFPTWAVARAIHVMLELTSPHPSPWWSLEQSAGFQNPASGLAHLATPAGASP